MDEYMEFWLVEQFVDLGSESFWHEKARFYRRPFHTDEKLTKDCIAVGERDVLKYGGRYRIRVVQEVTVYDSEEDEK